MKPLTYHPIGRWMIITLIAIGVYFFHQFLAPLLGALIIAIVTWPTYTELWQKCKEKNALSATIAIIFIALIIVLPILILTHYLIFEAKSLFNSLMILNKYGGTTPEWIKNLPLVGDSLNEYWIEFLGKEGGLNEILQLAGLQRVTGFANYILSLGRQIVSISFMLLFILIILFFLYKDGRIFSAQINKVGHYLFLDRWERIAGVVPVMIRATVSGMVIIAIGEGVVFGIIYYLVGAPSHLTLAIITGIFALIPGGAPMSMTMVSLYLVGSGHVGNGVFLFCWGTVQLFVVDKTIRPKLVGGPAKLPFLPTFFGLVGGLQTMGIIGLFVGPVIMALLLVIWREWVYDEEYYKNLNLPQGNKTSTNKRMYLRRFMNKKNKK